MVFLIILLFLNYLTDSVGNSSFNAVVNFLNDNILLIVAMSLIFLLGDVFGALFFPLNLPAPLFNAIGSVFLVVFIFRIFEMLESMINVKIFGIFREILPLIYPLVFIIVLVVGYVILFARLFEKDEDECVRREKTVEDKTEPKKQADEQSAENKKSSGEKTWDDVAGEFRGAVYDVLHAVREAVSRKGD
jgi:hypothetical protein